MPFRREGVPFSRGEGMGRSTLRAIGAASLGLAAISLLVVSYSSSGAPLGLLQEGLDGQHLMSADSRHTVWSQSHDTIFETEGHAVKSKLTPWTGKRTSTFDRLKGISSNPVDAALNGIKESLRQSEGKGKSHSFYGSWGHANKNFYAKNNYEHKEDTWDEKMQKLRKQQAMQRHEENSEYFKGIEKAFGKKAGLAMMKAFDGHSGRGKSADSNLLKDKLSSKTIAYRKRALADSTVLPSTHKQDSIAASMHKKMMGGKPKASLHHLGVVADTKEMKKLAHEFHHAHGKEKKVLKARVMQLQQQIVDSFKKVTEFGSRASTQLARETAKEKANAKK